MSGRWLNKGATQADMAAASHSSVQDHGIGEDDAAA